MPYRDSSGGSQNLNVTVNGYVFALNQTKTVKNIKLPSNANVVIMAIALANDSVNVPLTTMTPIYNRAGIYTDGTTFTNPATGGLDEDGSAYSATLLNNFQIYSNSIMAFGPFSATDVVSCAGQVIALPPGNYSRVQMLATGVNGNQSPGSFAVTYSDSTETLLSQNFSDWFTPNNNAGEIKQVIMSYRNVADGTEDNRTFYLYGYSFKLNSAKTVSSLTLPNDANVIVTAINLVPNWPPTFGVNPLTLPGATQGQAYSASIATNATDINGDSLTFAKVGGPSWLSVASNGALFGTPPGTNGNLNTFLVSVTDPGGLSSTDTVNISITTGPSFTANPFTMPSTMAGQIFTNTVATNVTEPNLGDTPAFSLVSGPAWLSITTSGALSGEPLSANVGTNTYVVSVIDQTGLSNIATMYVPVTAAPPILPAITQQSGTMTLYWSGGIGPYDVQMTTNLLSPNWQDLGSVGGTNLVVIPSNNAAFYRIIGQ